MKLAIVIPAYNEEKTLENVIKTLPKKFLGVTKKEVIIINDGSHDKTQKIASKLGVTVIRHFINRGLGSALGTGFEYAKNNDFDLLITFDADGQHHPDDIAPLLKPLIKRKADIVIGTRLKNPEGMPWYRKVGIFGLNLVTYLLFWVWTSDTQSGLRGFSKKAIEKIDIQSNKMEVSSEFFYEAGKKDLKIAEVPIASIYTKYSLSKGIGKGQFRHGFGIISRMILKRIFSK